MWMTRISILRVLAQHAIADIVEIALTLTFVNNKDGSIFLFLACCFQPNTTSLLLRLLQILPLHPRSLATEPYVTTVPNHRTALTSATRVSTNTGRY
jgi:hypothetical protein